MGREHRIISALAGTGVPVPPALGLCSDAAVNGAPFYVMAFVEGVVLDLGSTVEKHIPQPEARRGLGRHVIEVLARLHAVDVDAIGLGDLGRREGYVPRQLKRWRTQWEQSKTRELPAMEAGVRGARVGHPRAARLGRRARRLPAREHAHRRGRAHRRRARLGAVHARRSARRPRLPDEQLGRAGRERAREPRRRARAHRGGRLPEPARDARPLPGAHAAATSRRWTTTARSRTGGSPRSSKACSRVT